MQHALEEIGLSFAQVDHQQQAAQPHQPHLLGLEGEDQSLVVEHADDQDDGDRQPDGRQTRAKTDVECSLQVVVSGGIDRRQALRSENKDRHHETGQCDGCPEVGQSGVHHDRKMLGEDHDWSQRDDQQGDVVADSEGRLGVPVLDLLATRQGVFEETPVLAGLHPEEDGIKHDADDDQVDLEHEDRFLGHEGREKQTDTDQHDQAADVGVRTLHVERLEPVLPRTDQDREAEETVQRDHQHAVHRVACHLGVLVLGEHDGRDHDRLESDDRDSEDQRSVGFTELLG